MKYGKMAEYYSSALWKVYTATETFISHEIWMESSRDDTHTHTHTHTHINACIHIYTQACTVILASQPFWLQIQLNDQLLFTVNVSLNAMAFQTRVCLLITSPTWLFLFKPKLMDGTGAINGTKRRSLKMNILLLFTPLHDFFFSSVVGFKGIIF